MKSPPSYLGVDPPKESREWKVEGFIPSLIVVTPWFVGMFVIAKATIAALF